MGRWVSVCADVRASVCVSVSVSGVVAFAYFRAGVPFLSSLAVFIPPAVAPVIREKRCDEWVGGWVYEDACVCVCVRACVRARLIGMRSGSGEKRSESIHADYRKNKDYLCTRESQVRARTVEGMRNAPIVHPKA